MQNVWVVFVLSGMENNERHRLKFAAWRSVLSHWIWEDRGRATRLAIHLGVPRVDISNWFTLCRTNPPAWSIVPTLEFFSFEQTRCDYPKVPRWLDIARPTPPMAVDGNEKTQKRKAVYDKKLKIQIRLHTGRAGLHVDNDRLRTPTALHSPLGNLKDWQQLRLL